MVIKKLDQLFVQQHLKPQFLFKNTTIHSLFDSFFFNDIEQDADTTSLYIKQSIELLKDINIIFADINTIWEKKDVCAP